MLKYLTKPHISGNTWEIFKLSKTKHHCPNIVFLSFFYWKNSEKLMLINRYTPIYKMLKFQYLQYICIFNKLLIFLPVYIFYN